MRSMFLLRTLTLVCLLAGVHCGAQTAPADLNNYSAAKKFFESDQVLDRIAAKELEEIQTVISYRPIVETYIQEIKLDENLGDVPENDQYFLYQADFTKGIKTHSLIPNTKKFSWFSSFAPAGFLQMAFIDNGGIDRAHFKFKYVRREFLSEVRCVVYDIEPLPTDHHARFVGRIWVEDKDYAVVRFNGVYAPSINFSWKTFEDGYYFQFDSWRVNVQPGIWLPYSIFSKKFEKPSRFNFPNFKSQTRLWGYNLKNGGRATELSRVLVENSTTVKDEAAQQDRSPLEMQREWRHEAESNVLDLLERNGFLSPPGPVDTTLNTVVSNLEITNNLDGQIDLHCRVLLTTNLEMFSIGSTIVVSRGLIDTVPDEATLAAMLAHGIADAMLAKPYQDQYGFSDVMRLTTTQVLKHLSFRENPAELTANNQKALELLKKSPYADKLANAGLYLKQLQSESGELKRLISPQLGNEPQFTSQIIQTAPNLQPNDKSQITALPMGSRIKIDPWNGAVVLMKTKSVSLNFARDKMPFEITPLIPYITRYVESSETRSTSSAESFDP